MPPSNAMENDKKRLRNQFTKDERTRLLSIMTEYGPLLDDKNISILSRKEIWEIIENKFNENGHSGRTSAQLKKYWQNYKYHSKRTKIIHKEVPKPLSPMTKQMVRMLAKVNPEEWAQYDVALSSRRAKKSPQSSPDQSTCAALPLCTRLSKIPTTPFQRSTKPSAADGTEPRVTSENLVVPGAGCKSEIPESNVVVSTTDTPGSSVTVSVICPEVSSKARTIFWKRNASSDKVGLTSQTNGIDDFAPEVGASDISGQETDDQADNPRSGNPVRHKSYGNRLNVAGILAEKKPGRSDNTTKKSGRYSQIVSNGQTPVNITAGMIGKSELIGNANGVVVKEAETTQLSKACDPTEISGPLISATKSRNDAAKVTAGGSVLNLFGTGTIISRDNRAANNADDGKVEFAEILREIAAVNERTGILRQDVKETTVRSRNGAGNERNFEGEIQDMMRFVTINSPPQDFLRLKLYLGLISGVGQVSGAGGSSVETLRKFEALISKAGLAKKRNETEGMEIDEDTNAENGAGGGRLRVRRGSLMAPGLGGDGIEREIKVETEMEPEAAGAGVEQNPLNADNAGDNRAVNSIDHLVQAKLQCAKSELGHQLKLQKLEIEEKELRVRIAEMTVQETRLRIQALVDERLRATELHKLRLAQMGGEKAEHAARIDASCTAKAEGRARISSVERENLYEMKLRCVGGSSANGNCAVKCKQYQQ